jgi:hypothetical protein
MPLRLAPLLALVALALAAAPAAADVAIVWNGTTQRLDPDPATLPTDQTTPPGWLLTTLLRAAHVHPGPAWYATAGTAVLLGSSAADNTLAPFVYRDQQGLQLVNPREQGATDVVPADAGELTIDVRKGDLMRIHASKLRVRVGEAVSFSPVLKAGDGPGITFSWFFEDGGGLVTGRSVRDHFSHPGSHIVTLDANGDGPAAGAHAVATVDVAAPAHRHKPGVTGNAGVGTAVGAGTAVRSGTTGGGGAAAPRRATGRPGHAVRPPRAVVVTPPQGDLVSGTLLDAADSAPLTAGYGASGARAREGATATDAPLHVPVGVWVAAGLAALLGLGWALESRHAPPFWQP